MNKKYHIGLILFFILNAMLINYFLVIRTPLTRFQTVKSSQNRLLEKIKMFRHPVKNSISTRQLAWISYRLKHPFNRDIFLTRVAVLCEKLSLSAQTISPQKTASQKNITTNSIHMTATGDYPNMIKFINALSAMPWVVSFSTLELNQSSQGVELHLVIEINYY